MLDSIHSQTSTSRQHISDAAARRNSDAIEELLQANLPVLCNAQSLQRAQQYACTLISHLRARQRHLSREAIMQAFPLSSPEGIALMSLAESLLRIPDNATADALIADRLRSCSWQAATDALPARTAAFCLRTVAMWLAADPAATGHHLRRRANTLAHNLARFGARKAVSAMAGQFVLGNTIEHALHNARRYQRRGYYFSFDMLGEGARSQLDAERYLSSYRHAIRAIGMSDRTDRSRSGISVKLTALHPHVSIGKAAQWQHELIPRLKSLCLDAAARGTPLTLDAEEVHRLEVTLDIFESLYRDPDLSGWDGLGIAVQAYQKTAPAVIEHLASLAKRGGKEIPVRLVKGAYWDSEIKLAQQGGYTDFPVYTHKAATDVAYLHCAQRLLAHHGALYPQFATHNALTIALILEMLAQSKHPTTAEFQRLHGMGTTLYDQVMREMGIPCRIYAPVGNHRDLLAYLVRRLLENAANSSFVQQTSNPSVSPAALVQNPQTQLHEAYAASRSGGVRLPADLYGADRNNARGWNVQDHATLITLKATMHAAWNDFSSRLPVTPVCTDTIPVINPANQHEQLGQLQYDSQQAAITKLERAERAHADWAKREPTQRALLLRKLASRLEAEAQLLIALCVKEAGKTLADSVAELREAVDFCRYYAQQIEQRTSTLAQSPYHSRGVVLCISPWNFPLAIFVGQIAGTLAAGNCVLAKPAEQTSLVALEVFRLLQDCGFSDAVVQLLIGPGKPFAEVLLPDTRIAAVQFTGSTATAAWIAAQLAKRPDAPVPLIAETGGQNAMIADSSALPEQLVDAVIKSGFLSAGQRCSAARVLFLQDEIADPVITMLVGAMASLSMGDPSQLETDVGPVIDNHALERLNQHVRYLDSLPSARHIYTCESTSTATSGHYFAPRLYEIDHISLLPEEVFGPIVHCIRYRADQISNVIDQINNCGYGLTAGIHSRIRSRCRSLANSLNVGNVYINRDIVGAVVGVQPFGGHGRSGTGPKAGGPDYIGRLQTLTADSQSALPLTEQLIKRHVPRQFLQWLYQWPLQQPDSGCDAAALTTQAQQLLAHLYITHVTTRLPGSEGEINELSREKRGHIIVVLHERQHYPHAMLSSALALAAGNSIAIWCSESCLPLLKDTLMKGRDLGIRGIDSNAVRAYDSEGTLLQWCKSEVLDALVISPDCGIKSEICRALHLTFSVIPCMICEHIGADYPQRFVVEKVISENSAALGGDLALLSR